MNHSALNCQFITNPAISCEIRITVKSKSCSLNKLLNVSIEHVSSNISTDLMTRVQKEAQKVNFLTKPSEQTPLHW